MDVSGLTGMSSALTQVQANDQIGVAVLKKALDAETQSAMALIQALPQPQSVNPAHLGQNVDVKA